MRESVSSPQVVYSPNSVIKIICVASVIPNAFWHVSPFPRSYSLPKSVERRAPMLCSSAKKKKN